MWRCSMPSVEDRTQTLRGMVASVTGRPTYVADGSFAQPAEKYCTVKLIGHRSFEHDTVEDTDGFHQKVRGLATLDFSIQAIGGNEEDGTGAVQALRRFFTSLCADLPRETLLRAGMGVSSIGQVVDISAVIAGRIEDRAAVIISIIASCEEIFDFDSATQAEITINEDPPVAAPTDPPDCPAGG